MSSAAAEEIRIGPQKGPQTAFLSTSADICLYGGAAGGGKSFGLLLEPLRHSQNPKFGAVCFRKESTQIRQMGGLWDTSYQLYGALGADPLDYRLEWTFESGMVVKFAHLQHESDVSSWQGSQIPLIMFDEVTHFSEKQFTYMLSRNRSDSGVSGYVRATCNPDPDSWVRQWVDWWIGPDGYPIPERSGVIRWFIRVNDAMIWADTREELLETYGSEQLPKSFTFIPSKLQDNRILMEKDPSYLANLRALPLVDRLRLEGGNWNVRAAAGLFFNRGWFSIVEAIPAGWVSAVRYWDRAATVPNQENPDPDWTRGLLLLKYPNKTYLVADLRSLRKGPNEVEIFVRNTAEYDGRRVKVMSQQDPGSAGVMEALQFKKLLQGFDVRTETLMKDKITRAKAVSAQAEAGNIMVLRAPWNREFFDETDNFPMAAHDDIVDVFSGAFNHLTSAGASILDAL